MEPSSNLSTPEELQTFLLIYMQDIDILSLSSPFLPKTYTKVRSDLFAQYKGSLASFISIVDTTIFPKYLKLVSHAYEVSILKDPSMLDLPVHDETASEMIKILTEWSVQIEVSMDLVQRCQLYKIYETSETQEQVLQDLKKEWKNTENHSNALYRYFIDHFSLLTEQFKSLVTDKLCDLMVHNLIETHGYTISKVFFAYFSASMPYPIVALVGARFVWMFINKFSDKISEKLMQPLEKLNLQLKLSELRAELKGMTKELTTKNKSIALLIPESISNKKSRRYLKTLIDSTLSHNPENHSKAAKNDFDTFITQFSTIHEEDDWVIIDRPSLYPEMLEGWDLLE